MRISDWSSDVCSSDLPALSAVEAALDVANSFRDRPAGRLRLNVPLAASKLVLPRIVPPFLAAYPDICLEVIVEDRYVDLLQSDCDAGIRYEEAMDQDMVAIPIGPKRQRMALAASPAYLAQHGHPRRPDDLRTHIRSEERLVGKECVRTCR